MPRCFVKHRRVGSFGSKEEPVVNTMVERRAEDLDKVRAGRWLKISAHSQEAIDAVGVRSSIDMHVGLHYGRQANRGGALFSREALDQGQEFHAHVWDVPEEVASIKELSMGKRSSVNGRVKITWEEGKTRAATYSRVPETVPAEPVFLQLLTDALVVSEHGGWMRNLGTNGEAVVKDCVVSTRRSRGWSGRWGLPTGQIQVIEAGSVWLVEPRDSGLFLGWLQNLATEGIGLRRHEGFGWMAVNPGWLRDKRVVKEDSEVEPVKGKDPDSWPGLSISRDRQKQIAVIARRIAGEVSAVAYAEQLLTMALRGTPWQEVCAFLPMQAARRKGDWKGLDERIHEPMTQMNKEEGVLFLEALSTEMKAIGLREQERGRG
jgi:hypothetical protein